MTTKNALIALAVAIVGVLLYGAYQFPQVQQLVGSPVGTTFSTAKYAAINFSIATASSTAILNSDASDRYITTLEFVCNGIGTSVTPFTGGGLPSNGLKFQAATTSNATASTTNGNLVFNTTIATSTVTYSQASSTLVLSGTMLNNIWASGSYLQMFTNATNTASCTAGVRYIAE